MSCKQLITLCSFAYLLHTSASSQIMVRLPPPKPNYCLADSAQAQSMVGKPVKIFDGDGFYTNLHGVQRMKWLFDEIRQKGGYFSTINNIPKMGDTCTVVHVFTNVSGPGKHIYIVKRYGYYVGVGCDHITDIDKPDLQEQWERNRIADSIAYVDYEAGCSFKSRRIPGGWSRPGVTELDQLSESFACNLTTSGIDTLMLCKYILDRSPTPHEKAFVVWLDSGRGFVKAFFNNKKYQPTENKVMPFDAQLLLGYFFNDRPDTIQTITWAPVQISHSMGYSIQVYAPGYFYRERLTDFVLFKNPAHPMAAWWNLVKEKLATIKPQKR